MSEANRHSHLPIGTFPAIGDIPAGHAAMRQRIRELEDLCAEVYEVAVVGGLPPNVLAKLWKVAAHGNTPQGFAVDWPDTTPIDISLIHRPTAMPIAMPALPELAALGERRTIMVVDDDPAMLDLILKILEMENYEVLSADSGEAALAQCESGEALPELLITDLMMPGISGSHLAAAMRKIVPTLRVLYQTGFTDALFKAKQELEPGAAFIEKPFTARGLMEAARLALFNTMQPTVPTAPPPRTLWRFFD